MDIKDFFELGSKLVSSTVQAHPIGLRPTGKLDDIGDAYRLLKGEFASIQFPVTFRQEYGTRLCDALDTGYPGLYLISNRMKSALEAAELTGWTTFPIRLLDKQGNDIDGYQGFSVTGRCGPIDVSKSQIIEKRLVPNGPLCIYYKGLHVGLDRWDGRDFFLPKRNYGTIVTTKGATIIKSSRLTNIRLTNLTDIEIGEMTANLIRSKSKMP
ncbi:MAG: DUF1629 domain-containing protein [Acidobacteriota bacterium]